MYASSIDSLEFTSNLLSSGLSRATASSVLLLSLANTYRHRWLFHVWMFRLIFVLYMPYFMNCNPSESEKLRHSNSSQACHCPSRRTPHPLARQTESHAATVVPAITESNFIMSKSRFVRFHLAKTVRCSSPHTLCTTQSNNPYKHHTHKECTNNMDSEREREKKLYTLCLAALAMSST